MKDETHENINFEVNKNKLYKLDEISPDDKYWCRRSFESKIENICDIKWQNGMTFIHTNEVNKMVECDLLHDVPNPSERTKH